MPKKTRPATDNEIDYFLGAMIKRIGESVLIELDLLEDTPLTMTQKCEIVKSACGIVSQATEEEIGAMRTCHANEN